MVLWLLPRKTEHDHPTLTGVGESGDTSPIRYIPLYLLTHSILDNPATALGEKHFTQSTRHTARGHLHSNTHFRGLR